MLSVQGTLYGISWFYVRYLTDVVISASWKEICLYIHSFNTPGEFLRFNARCYGQWIVQRKFCASQKFEILFMFMHLIVVFFSFSFSPPLFFLLLSVFDFVFCCCFALFCLLFFVFHRIFEVQLSVTLMRSRVRCACVSI